MQIRNNGMNKRQLLSSLLSNDISLIEFREEMKDPVGLQYLDLGNGTGLVKGGSQKLNEIMTLEQFNTKAKNHTISLRYLNDD